jgi:UDP-glucose 4-epimerase
MRAHGVQRIVFSSSATVYGDPQRPAHHRRRPAVGHQPLRPDQADGRDHPARPGRGRCRLADRLPALLQPGGRARQRPHRRRPARHAQQPDALRGAGGGGPAQRCRCSATTTPRPTAPACATTSTSSTSPKAMSPPAAAVRPARLVHRQPGHRPRPQRAGRGEGLRRRQRPRGAVPRGAAPPGRRGRLLGRPGARRAAAGLAARHDLPRMCADSWRWQQLNPHGFDA